MKRFLLAVGAGLMALSMASPSFAADLPRPAYKSPVYVAPYFSWTGFYVGINGGYGWGKSSWDPTGFAGTGDFTVKGPIVGGTLGYNLQTGSWVFGLEADADISWIKGTTTTGFCGVPGCETSNRWLATGRGRIGYAWDRWLPYITGGVAYGDVKMTAGAAGSETKSKLGWTAGAGVEYAFMGAWSAKLEYLYVDLGKSTCGAALCGVDTSVKFNAHIGKIGVNYRF